MIALLLFVLPVIAGLITFMLREKAARNFAIFAALGSLALAAAALWVYPANPDLVTCNYQWIAQLGARFYLKLDGLGLALILLTSLVMLAVIMLAGKRNWPKSQNFLALLLLTQAGLVGVFSAYDALLFYFCWELVLIPVYFLASIWGGINRIAVTFKFFLYTFTGSLMMLAGIIYLYFQTPGAHSFSLEAFSQLHLPAHTQFWVMPLLLIAFAIKIPVFPFHTWLADTYQTSPTPVTAVLSALMVKMGLLGIIRWILPVFHIASAQWAPIIIGLAVVGLLYASLLAWVQTDLKRLFAYSSMAHMGLMTAALFAGSVIGWQGVMVQMFSHGIVIMGLWAVVDVIERRWGTTDMRQLGGLAQIAPGLSIALVVISLANIALPLTSGFVGEFMMFTGLFSYSAWWMAAAGVAMILSAVYMLSMIRQVVFGEVKENLSPSPYKGGGDLLVFGAVVVVILFIGIYPTPLLHLINETTQMLQSIAGQF